MAKTHGLSSTDTYMVWKGMHKRCNNRSDKSYKNYGGRGISVCKRWAKFENFLLDMGERKPGMSIERINNSGGYSPENCRWIKMGDQAKNKRNNLFITHNGKTLHLQEWCRITGLWHGTIRNRLSKGWPMEKVLDNKQDFREVKITYKGKTLRATDWAKVTGIHYGKIIWRFKKGWPIDRVFKK